MNKKVFAVVGSILLFIFSAKTIFAADYVINDFQSRIEVQRDTSLMVTETIKVNFFAEKHGIFRVIPIIYSAAGRTINAKFNLLSIGDEIGRPIPYTTSRLAQSIKIKIGDPDRVIIGEHSYIVKYSIKKVLLQYEDYDEIYWNVTGFEWDTNIDNVSAVVESPYAILSKVKCYTGVQGSREENCTADFSNNKADFSSTVPLNIGENLTIVAGFDKKNNLVFPSATEQKINFIIDNWGYLAAITPFLIMFFAWRKKGRDLRFESDNVYVKPEDTRRRTVGLFEREHLPLAYSPIAGLTPSELGTIFDERVDINDVVAEIVELARLKYLKIEKIEKKAFLHTDVDYVFTNLNKDASKLKDFQQFLVSKIFDGKETIKLSSLKNKFYVHLLEFKNKLYKHITDQKYFDGNPRTKKTAWFIIGIFLNIACFIILTSFTVMTANPGPYAIFFPLGVASLFFAFAMPRRSAWGHSLYRQAIGLKYYIGVGKWRYEVAEKNLFVEEILPLAIALGVVNKLADQMKELEMEPPSYLNGFATAYFVSDFNRFQSQAGSTLAISPSGHSSWSGGSGFSSGGGFSGGGFGGGGGGSW